MCGDQIVSAEFAAKLEAELIELRDQYKRLHSQVAGYIHGVEWEHWQKYNEPKYAPAATLNDQAKI